MSDDFQYDFRFLSEASNNFDLSPSPEVSSSSVECGGTLTESVGQFRSPGFPNVYPGNLHCVWEIQAPPGFAIDLQILHLDVEDFIESCVDRLEVKTVV